MLLKSLDGVAASILPTVLAPIRAGPIDDLVLVVDRVLGLVLCLFPLLLGVLLLLLLLLLGVLVLIFLARGGDDRQGQNFPS